ncbi:MAG: alpha/beta fold hydrolase [Methylotetracoccus sp.]
MKTFLLIHGGSHGAWCWEPLVAALEARGHAALAFDLPGHGADRTPRRGIDRQTYVDAIVRYIRDKDLRRFLLVGHSLAGTVLPEVWSQEGDRIDGVVFLAALVLGAGEATIDLVPEERRSGYYDSAARRADRSFVLDPARARELFYNDCSDEDAARYCRKLTPQPFGVYLDRCRTAIRLPREVVRYILCTGDRALPEDLCLGCAAKLGVDAERFAAGHCAMLTQPARLAEVLLGPA